MKKEFLRVKQVKVDRDHSFKRNLRRFLESKLIKKEDFNFHLKNAKNWS